MESKHNRDKKEGVITAGLDVEDQKDLVEDLAVITIVDSSDLARIVDERNAAAFGIEDVEVPDTNLKEYMQVQLLPAIKKVLSELPKKEAEAIRLFFGLDFHSALGHSQEEIGIKEGITQQAVALRIKRGIQKMKLDKRKKIIEAFRDNDA